MLALLTLMLVAAGSPPRKVSTAGHSRDAANGGASSGLAREAHRLWTQYKFDRAAELYEQAAREELKAGRFELAARRLSDLAACRMARFEYRRASEAYQQALALARKHGYDLELGAIALNLSALYLQSWELDHALEAAAEGLEAVHRLPKPPFYQAQLYLHLAGLHARQGRGGEADALFRQSIDAADLAAASDVSLQARARDHYGAWLLSQGRVQAGADLLYDAFRRRRLQNPGELGFSYGRLAELKLEERDFPSARRLIELALASAGRGEPALPSHVLYHLRGRIRQADGDPDGALQDFRTAMKLAESWRLGMLPADSYRASSNSGLYSTIAKSFVECAAERALERSDAASLAESFLALIRWRAASLDESSELREAWRRRLAPEYWEVLGKLRTIELKRLRGNSVAGEALRLRLAELENAAGDVNQVENFRTQKSLILFQSGLSQEDALIAFHLGDTASYLWALTRNGLELHRLRPKKEILERVSSWRKALIGGERDSHRLGAELYATVFGSLSKKARQRPTWRLAVDEGLYEAPFAALVIGRKGGRTEYLIEQHTIEIVPGGPGPARPESDLADNRLLGLGDPIYNTADPRWRESGNLRWWQRWAGTAVSENQVQLSRLVASNRELNNSAQAWTGSTDILVGERASRERFLAGLEKQPRAVHLATHILTPIAKPDRALIAFSLGRSGEVEILTTADVGMLKIPRAIVTLSGCHSAAGEALPGTGLIGMSRAWLMAGASGVVATLWPVTDAEGGLFSHFYRNLLRLGAGRALRHAQLQMLKAQAWRKDPRYWAAYVLFAGGR
jgi:CHAT domain-containing protein